MDMFYDSLSDFFEDGILEDGTLMIIDLDKLGSCVFSADVVGIVVNKSEGRSEFQGFELQLKLSGFYAKHGVIGDGYVDVEVGSHCYLILGTKTDSVSLVWQEIPVPVSGNIVRISNPFSMRLNLYLPIEGTDEE